MAYPMGFPPQGIIDTDTRTSTIVVAASNSLDPTLAPLLYRCSGVADNVEMNAALVAAAAVNGSVELLEGDYNTVLTLSVAVNVTLKATGWGAVINFNAGGNAITIAGDNVKLRDFKVVIVAGAGAGGSRPNCVYATGRTNVEISKLWLVGDETVGDDGSFDRQDGILFGDNVSYSKIEACTIQDFLRIGIAPRGTAGNELLYIEIIGNFLISNGYDGIRCDYTDHSTITGNFAIDTETDGIALISSENNTVTGNTCSGNGWNGITIYSDNCTVSGNTCHGNTSCGIRLLAASNCTVTGNTCIGNTQAGIFLMSTSINNTVVGNTCNGNTLDGIFLAENSGNNTVTGNTCSLNVEHGISLDGSDNCTVSGNTCIGNDSGDTGNYDGINLDTCDRILVVGNQCQNQQGWGIQVDDDSNYCKISNNYTNGNVAGSINVNGATCDNNQVEWNTVEEGAPVNTGTNTRAYGNYDPSANAFVGDVGAAPW